MALSSTLPRLILVCVTLVISFSSADAQTFHLYLTGFDDKRPAPLQMIDTSAGPVSAPALHPEKPILYYLRQRSGKHEVVAFNTASDERTIIFTSEQILAELRVTPDGKSLTFLSKSPATELKRLPLGGATLSTVLDGVRIQNYIWIDDNNLLVIETGDPNTLQLLSLRPFRQVAVARHVGHTLTYIPELASFAFVHKLSVDSWSIKTIGPDGAISILAQTLPESEFFFITSAGTPVGYYEDKFYRYQPLKKDWSPAGIDIPGKVVALQAGRGKLAFWVKNNM